MSLRARIISLVALVFIAGEVFGALLAGYQARQTLADELRAALLGGQQTVLSAFEDLPRSDHAPRDLHQLVSTFDGNRHVRALLETDDGKVIEHSVQLDHGPYAPRWFAQLLGRPPPPITVQAPAPVVNRQIFLEPTPDIDVEALWQEVSSISVALIASVAAGLILLYLIVGRALRPLRVLAAATTEVGKGNYRVMVPVAGSPELRMLQMGFNEMAGRLLASDNHNRKLEAQLANLQEEERADLARDLHDEFGPHLFAVSVDAELIGQLTPGAAPVGKRIQSIQASIARMQGLVRDMLNRLRPTGPTELGLNVALMDLAEFWRTRAPDIGIDLNLLEDEQSLDETIREVSYRVVQEALSNAVRHARADRITVNFHAISPAEIQIEIADDGAGGGAVGTSGMGLKGMGERVKNANGLLEIEASRSGWRVKARLPTNAASSKAAAPP